MAKRATWGSRVTFVLSAIGFAAGIGNFWRFPYLVGKYGGGVFLAFYLLVVTLIGIPLLSIEIALGKTTKKDPVGAYKKLAPGKFWYVTGYLNLLTILLIIGYASVVGGWIVAYCFKTATGTFAHMTPAKIDGYFGDFTAKPVEVILWTVLFIVSLVAVLLQGLNRGIEKVNKVMLPALFVLIVILIVRSLTLPDIEKGLSFYLKPQLSRFTREGALAAIGQAFFSVGVAMAAGLVYGSYLKDEEKIVSNAVIIGGADTLVAVLAGLIIFPATAAFSLEPGAGPGLTFITMPNVFNQMPLGNLFGTLFYLLFFLAAFTSFIGGSEAVVAHLSDEWNLPRKTGVWVTLLLMLAIAVPSAIYSQVFATLDRFANNYLLIIGGLLMTLFVGWIWPLENFFAAAGIQSKPLKAFWAFAIKFFAPLTITLLWLNQLGFVH